MRQAIDTEEAFLAALGRRVRNTRALRGMSRKVLTKASGVSERYIAQLESGRGIFRSCCCAVSRTPWGRISRT